MDDIKNAINEQPDIIIHEITEKLALPVSEETVRREVVKMGFVYKKKSLHISELERSRCERKAWTETIAEYPPEKLVYLDESGVNTNMTRIYGRAMGGERAVDNAPVNTLANTTILSSIRLNGETAYTTYNGGTTGDKFVDYLKNVLIPTLNKGDVIIMYNMRSHHVQVVREAIEEAEMSLLYLPPYSPDFNPIEQMWSRVKAILRKLKVRAFTELPAAIQSAFSLITTDYCHGWFSSAGVLG